MTNPNTEPAHDELADEFDQLDWDKDKFGPMRGYATGDDEVKTVPFSLEDTNGVSDNPS